MINGAIFALTGEKIINSEGKTLDEDEDFYPPEIAKRTYLYFLIGEFIIPIGLIFALLLIYEYKEENEQEDKSYSEKKKEKEPIKGEEEKITIETEENNEKTKQTDNERTNEEKKIIEAEENKEKTKPTDNERTSEEKITIETEENKEKTKPTDNESEENKIIETEENKEKTKPTDNERTSEENKIIEAEENIEKTKQTDNEGTSEEKITIEAEENKEKTKQTDNEGTSEEKITIETEENNEKTKLIDSERKSEEKITIETEENNEKTKLIDNERESEEKKIENVENQSNKKLSKRKIFQVIKTFRYWRIILISFLINIPMSFMISTGRTIGALIGINGNVLQLSGIIQVLAILILGPLLGSLVDKKGPLLLLRIAAIICVPPALLLTFFMSYTFVFIFCFIQYIINLIALSVSFSPFIMEVYGIQESVILGGIINGFSKFSDILITLCAFGFSLVCDNEKKCLKSRYSATYFISGICGTFSAILLFLERIDKFKYEKIEDEEILNNNIENKNECLIPEEAIIN